MPMITPSLPGQPQSNRGKQQWQLPQHQVQVPSCQPKPSSPNPSHNHDAYARALIRAVMRTRTCKAMRHCRQLFP